MDLPKKHILQYIIKKRKKVQPTWEDINELNQAKDQMMGEIHESGDSEDYYNNTLERVRYDVEKIGVMVAFVHPENNLVAIGYSLVNRKAGDKFDHQITHLGTNFGPVGYFEAEGFGAHIATGRAFDWCTTETMVYQVPPSIKVQFKKFIERVQRYYKDKDVPAWITNFLALS